MLRLLAGCSWKSVNYFLRASWIFQHVQRSNLCASRFFGAFEHSHPVSASRAGVPESPGSRDSRLTRYWYCTINSQELWTCTLFLKVVTKQQQQRRRRRRQLHSHFGSSRGHSWPGLSQLLSSHLCRFNQLLLLVDGAPTPCRRGFAYPYLRRRCCFFGHSPEEVAAESVVGRNHLLPCRDDAAPAGLDSMQRLVEPIVGAPVPQIWGPIVEGVQLAWSAHKIVLGSLSWICQCLRSRKLCQCPRLWRNLGIFRSACSFGAYPRTNFGSDLTGAADLVENGGCCTFGACGACARTNR